MTNVCFLFIAKNYAAFFNENHKIMKILAMLEKLLFTQNMSFVRRASYYRSMKRANKNK